MCCSMILLSIAKTANLSKICDHYKYNRKSIVVTVIYNHAECFKSVHYNYKLREKYTKTSAGRRLLA
jgi:hypothetical protein